MDFFKSIFRVLKFLWCRQIRKSSEIENFPKYGKCTSFGSTWTQNKGFSNVAHLLKSLMKQTIILILSKVITSLSLNISYYALKELLRYKN